MRQVLAADFETRADVEAAVEHIVQEYGVDRAAVTILATANQNSVGTRPSGSDLDDGHEKQAAVGKAPLAGLLRVSAEVDAGDADKVRSAFATYGGTHVEP